MRNNPGVISVVTELTRVRESVLRDIGRYGTVGRRMGKYMADTYH